MVSADDESTDLWAGDYEYTYFAQQYVFTLLMKLEAVT
jgi:hypothetical protein